MAAALLAFAAPAAAQVSFGIGSVSDQTYTADTAIATLTLPIATGGSGTVTYTLTGPPGGQTLTPGLTFAANGGTAANPPTLTGTPNGGADAPFTYTATDASDSASLTFRITITGGPHFGEQTVPPQTYTVGVEIDLLTLPEILNDPGGLIVVRDVFDEDGVSVGSAFGLQFSSNGVLNGTPTRAGNFQAIYGLTRLVGTSGVGVTRLRFTITVLPAPTFARTQTDLSFTQFTPIPAPIPLPTASGGVAPLSFTLTGAGGAALPEGLDFDTTTNPAQPTLGGAPTTFTAAGGVPLTYTVRDANAAAAEQTFSVTITASSRPALTFEYDLPNLTYVQLQGDDISLTFPAATNAADAAGTVTYTLTSSGGSGADDFLGLTYDDEERRLFGIHPEELGSRVLTYRAADDAADPLVAPAELIIGLEVPDFGALLGADRRREFVYRMGEPFAMTLPQVTAGRHIAPLTEAFIASNEAQVHINFGEATFTGNVNNANPSVWAGRLHGPIDENLYNSEGFAYDVRDAADDVYGFGFAISFIRKNGDPAIQTGSGPDFGTDGWRVADRGFLDWQDDPAPTLPAQAWAVGTPITPLSMPLVDRDTVVGRVNGRQLAPTTAGLSFTGSVGPFTGVFTPDIETARIARIILQGTPTEAAASAELTVTLTNDTPRFAGKSADIDSVHLTFRASILGFPAADRAEAEAGYILDPDAVDPAVTLPSVIGAAGATTTTLLPRLAADADYVAGDPERPAYILFDAGTRRLSFGGSEVPAGDGRVGATTLTYTVSDTANPALSVSLTFQMRAPKLYFAGTPLTDYALNIGQALDLTLPQVDTTASVFSDPDNSGLTYTLADAAPGWLKTALDGDTGVVTIAAVPDEASAGEYTYTVREKGGDASASLALNITVARAPVFGDSVPPQSYTMGHAITPLTLPIASGGHGTITYAISDFDGLTGLTFDESGGVYTFTGAVTSAAADTPHNVVWRATDDSGRTANLTFSVRVFPPLTLEAQSGGGALGLTFTAEFPVEDLPADTRRTGPAASGGTPPLTYTMAPDPAFSSGRSTLDLVMNPDTGVISGTVPESQVGTNGLYGMTYTVTGANGASAANSVGDFNIRISPPIVFGDTNVVAEMNHRPADDGSITPLTLPDITGGTGTLSFALTPDVATDPAFAGLTFNSNTRVLSGTLAANANGGELVWKGTDAIGAFAALTFDVRTSGPSFANVDPVPPQTFIQPARIAPLTLPVADESNATLPVAYTLTGAGGGDLPEGLAFAAARNPSASGYGGLLRGTPSGDAGEFTLTYTARDSDTPPVFDSLFFTVTVVAPNPGLPSPGNQTFPKGAGFTFTMPEASAGTAPLTFTLADADGNLPDGVSFDDDPDSPGFRTLSGTPTASTSALLTYTVRDADGREDRATFTLTIAGPTFPPLANQVFAVEEPINLTLPEVVSGAIGTVSYALPLPATLAGLVFTESTDPSTDGYGGVLAGELTMTASATLTYTATDAHDNDTGELIFTLTVRDAESPDAVNQMVLPEVARAVVGHTVGAIAGRVEQVVSGIGNAIPSANFGGQSSMAGIVATHGESLLNGGDSDDGMDAGALKALLGNSNFVLPLSTSGTSGTAAPSAPTSPPAAGAAYKASDGGAGPAIDVALWGSADYRRIEGDADFDWDGDLFSLHLGMDARLRNNALAGFAISWSESEIEYGDDSDARGEHELQLTTLSPYLGWQFSGGVSAWAAIGYGEGDLEITEAGADDTLTSDIETRSIAAGVSKPLAEGVGGTALRVKGEALHSELEVLGGGEELSVMEVSAQRLRLGLEGRRTLALSDGARLEPRLEVGLRHDGGDGETGSALELGAALRHHKPDSGLSTEAGAYALVGRDDYAEWGIHGLIRLTPGKDRQGIAFTLTPGYGARSESAATDRIWQQDLNLNADDANQDRDYAPRLDAQLGYTLSTPTIRGLLTPYSEMTMGGDDRTYRLGLRWSVDRLLDLNLTSERNQADDDPAEHAILLRGEVRF